MAFMVLVVAGYVTYSIFAWRSLRGRITIAMADFQTAVGELQAQDLTSERLQRAIDAMLRAGNTSSCQPPVVVAWQRHVVPSYDELLAQCNDVSRAVSIEAASKLREYSVFDQQVAGIVQRLSDSLRNAAAHDFDAMIAAWEQAQRSISQVAWNRDDDVRQLRDTLAQQALGVAQELRALKSAHDAKNRQQFDSARKKLSAARQQFVQSGQAATGIMSQRAKRLL